jgi:hypothetical protein
MVKSSRHTSSLSERSSGSHTGFLAERSRLARSEYAHSLIERDYRI